MSQAKIKGKVPVIILSIIALLNIGFADLLKDVFAITNIFVIGTPSFANIAFCVLGLCSIFISIAPSLILFVYVTFFSEKFRSKFFFAVIFSLLTIDVFIELIVKTFEKVFYNSETLFVILDVLQCIGLFGCIIAFLVSVVMSIIDESNKFTFIVGLLLAILLELHMFFCVTLDAFMYDSYLMIEIAGVMFRFLSVDLVSGFIEIIGTIVLYIALLIFVLTYNRKIIKLSQDMIIKNPEDALEILNQNLENGTITDEEYQTQREIIMNKL